MQHALVGTAQDSIVVEAPPWIRRLMPLMFLAGVASAWYFWNVLSKGGSVRVDLLLLTAVLVLCGPFYLVNGRRRIVMDRAGISEYRGEKLLRQYSIREVTAIRQEVNALKLVFSDRGSITIPNIWPGVDELRHHLQSVIDLQAAAPPVDDWLPLNYLTFPPRCVSCGSREVTVHHIFAGTKFHAPNVSWARGWDIPVPACPPCSRRRRVMGFVVWFLLVGGLVGLFLSSVISDRFKGMRPEPFVVAFLMVLVLLQVAVNVIPRWLDRRLLGVAALRLGKDKTTARLWFRDRQEEIVVRTLTAENRSREMTSTAETLRAT